jgi:hypothetical protein
VKGFLLGFAKKLFSQTLDRKNVKMAPILQKHIYIQVCQIHMPTAGTGFSIDLDQLEPH